MLRSAGLLFLSFCIASEIGHASPKTWIQFGAGIEGVESGDRFGTQVACDTATPPWYLNVGPGASGGLISTIAVSAPNAALGQGRVYLYDPLATGSYRQMLSPSTVNSVAGFGTAVEFVSDFNGDGIDDLVIGAPGDTTADIGSVFAFNSVISSQGLSYHSCGEVHGPLGFGSRIQGLQDDSMMGGSRIVISNPRVGRIDSFLIATQIGGGCSFTINSTLSESRGSESQYGRALTQVGPLSSSGSGAVGGSGWVAVAATGEGSLGAIYQSWIASPSLTDMLGNSLATPIPMLPIIGSAISGRADADSFVVGASLFDGGRGEATVYSLAGSAAGPICVLTNPNDDRSRVFASSVRHLGGSFLRLFGAGNGVVALRGSDAATGGGLYLTSVNGDGCSDLKEVNNCLSDAGQAQGQALAGGFECRVFRAGRIQELLLSGSPGWSGGRGRVDIAFEDGILDAPIECPVTTELSGQVGVTATPSATPNLLSPSLPSPSPLPTPAVNPENKFELSPKAIGEEAPGFTDTPYPEAPVIVAPGSDNLPDPVIVLKGNEVEVLLPKVTPSLALLKQAKMVRQLQKKRGLSRSKALRILNNQDNLVVTYVINYLEASSVKTRRFAFIQSAYADDSNRSSTKARQIRTRLNTITLRALRPGASYRLWYTVEISTRKPKAVLGMTRPSRAVEFGVGR